METNNNNIPKEVKEVIIKMQTEKQYYQRKINLLNKSIKLINKTFSKEK